MGERSSYPVIASNEAGCREWLGGMLGHYRRSVAPHHDVEAHCHSHQCFRPRHPGTHPIELAEQRAPGLTPRVFELPAQVRDALMQVSKRLATSRRAR